MKLSRVTLLLGTIVLLVAGLVGCSGESEGVDSTPVAAAKGPEQAVTRLAKGLADGRPEVAWQTLPPSYRKDVNELIQLAATKMDQDVWNQSFALVQKLTLLATEKREYILEQPMLAQNAESKQELEAGWDAFAGILDTLANSDLADLEKLQSIDVEQFLATTGNDLMQQMAAASALAPEDSWNAQMSGLRRTKATVVSESGKNAVVRVERPGSPPVEENYVQVEGHWIPEKLASSWSEEMTEARQKIEQMSTESLAENKQSLLMQISMVDAALDQLLQTKSREQFNAALAPIMGMAMGAMMAQASSSQMQVTPGTATLSEGPSTTNLTFPGAAAGPSFEQAQGALAGMKPDREVTSLTDGSHQLSAPGEVRFDQAHLYVGQYLRVNTSKGMNAICRLKETRPDALVFEKPLHGGSATFQVAEDELESLRILDH